MLSLQDHISHLYIINNVLFETTDNFTDKILQKALLNLFYFYSLFHSFFPYLFLHYKQKPCWKHDT